jgi:3-dehydroquinate synthase
MNPLTVKLARHTYPVEIGNGILPAWLERVGGLDQVALVTDEHVAALPAARAFIDSVQSRASRFSPVIVPAGEGSKNGEVFLRSLGCLAAAGLGRSATVIALGGGVVGDLAGFVAASYLRGVRFLQVPTTLLAMVDSSVGGKTGINLPEGKNLAGAFHQPDAVAIDLDWLDSLPPREFAAGMAEVVKYGIIRDPGLFAQVERGRPGHLSGVIRRCVEIKADVVAGDEKETTGLRAILNFGHTLGHAIEQSIGYGQLLHGEAISIGMSAAAFLSEKVCGLDPAVATRIRTALRSHHLPVHQPGLTYEALAPALGRDKKANQAGLRWILTPQLGITELRSDVSESLIREAIAHCAVPLEE